MDERERLDCALHGRPTDRPPCVCPGGMMNMITAELMDECGVSWPAAHTDAQMMADLALASFTHGCFENVGVPFCMTIEAEGLGAKVDLGDKVTEPHVCDYALDSVSQWEQLGAIDLESGRAKVVLDAIRILKAKGIDAPIVGNITGPVSTASSVMEPTTFYKELRRKRDDAHRYMQAVTDETIRFALAQVEAGADVIVVSDPSGTGEIMGPKLFDEFVVAYVNQIIDASAPHVMGTIVHICGHMNNVYEQADHMHSDVLSFDSCVSMRKACESIHNHRVMGNVSTVALEFGDAEQVGRSAVSCWRNGSSIVSPACGLGTKSPLANIQAIKAALVEEATAASEKEAAPAK